ncbi:MAG: glycoside hydrolase family 15 protein [Thermoplasmata archaeon]|nr:glycoside hydrolase family 15 protein [Thermoplasmata archaeon]MCI4358830.1 glycoside hydrolase family 15 protein [Thermoplasmata archaeon]
MEPRWTQANKEGVGTSPYPSSKIWFTIWRGVITEVYTPFIDQPQIRDLQFLVSDGKSFFHEEKRHLKATVHRLTEHSLGYRVNSQAPSDRYRLEKEIITDPTLPAVLQRTRIHPGLGTPTEMSVYALLAPHLGVAGWGNDGYVVQQAGREFLVAHRNRYWLALGASCPFRRSSVGFVGRSDGWTDLAENYLMDYEFDRATDGNIALTGELDATVGDEFTVGLAFGRDISSAITTLMQSLSTPFEEHQKRFRDGWKRVCRDLLPLGQHAGDKGNLFHSSHSLILAHEDKTYPGARIASLSIPWGQAHGDDDRGGYHLIWTRDLVHSAIGLLAAGNREAALRSLIYLAGSQREDGSFPQNSWLNGEAFYGAIQLDEVAFPVLLAGLLRREGALGEFDPWPMVRNAARFLIDYGPATQQERWEELAGYSPSTLASNVAALIVVATFARDRHDENLARFIEEYADWLNDHIERWTVTTRGTLVPEIARHYVRIRPADPMESFVEGPANDGSVRIANLPADAPNDFPVQEVVDAGFLELVRHGVRSPHDPTIARSVKVIDRVLKVETPLGPCWHRYNHDGYGQRDDGGPFLTDGVGRAWPLLTGERGHFELARGRDPGHLLHALERFASRTGLLPEQVWDQEDRPDLHLHLGRPTTAAMPLVWAHAEYLELLRSISDGRVFSCLAEVQERYIHGNHPKPNVEVWKPHYRPAHVPSGPVLRIQAPEPFRLHWSDDEWNTPQDTPSTETGLGIHFVELSTVERPGRGLVFTFYWPSRGTWEGRDYAVLVDPPKLTSRPPLD